ncbi:MAG: hypothetical protein SFZ03_00415 [Candidatus Melainabacteria bacterium]|nr:hypothetical protein [Candidatus Melainabacteria bacterium]
MTPRGPKRERSELPKPILQEGQLGYFPVHPLALACLHYGLGSLLIGHRDAEDTLTLKQTGTVALESGLTLELHQRFFNGMSDAFFRGRLSQVLMVAPDAKCANDLDPLVDEFADYVDKLHALGFLIPGGFVDPVEALFPNLVLMTPGLYYSTFLSRLRQNLANMDFSASVSGVGEKVLQKCIRGLFVDEHHLPVDVLSLQPSNLQLWLAGGSLQGQQTVQQLLERQGVRVRCFAATEAMAEALEFKLIHNVLTQRLLYAARLPKAPKNGWQASLSQAIVQVAQSRRAIAQNQELLAFITENLRAPDLCKKSPAAENPSPLPEDIRLLEHLLQVAQQFELNPALQTLKTLEAGL